MCSNNPCVKCKRCGQCALVCFTKYPVMGTCPPLIRKERIVQVIATKSD